MSDKVVLERKNVFVQRTRSQVPEMEKAGWKVFDPEAVKREKEFNALKEVAKGLEVEFDDKTTFNELSVLVEKAEKEAKKAKK